MTKFTIMFRIGAIIFISEGILTIFSFVFHEIIEIENDITGALVDSTVLILLTSPLIYFLVIKPYMEERVDLLIGVQNMLSEKET